MTAVIRSPSIACEVDKTARCRKQRPELILVEVVLLLDVLRDCMMRLD
jgi:hypothetical protein